jgi:hypothetical protein
MDLNQEGACSQMAGQVGGIVRDSARTTGEHLNEHRIFGRGGALQ